MYRIATPFLMLIAAMPAAQSADPAGKVANPTYASWAKFPVGTAVTLTTVTDVGGSKTEAAITMTLTELTADKAVIEMESEVNAGGKPMKMKAGKQEYERLVESGPAGTPQKPPGTVEQSAKEITLLGKTYQAKYAKIDTEVAGSGAVVAETWSSDDVPGTLLKSVSRTKVSGQDFTSTMTLTKIVRGK